MLLLLLLMIMIMLVLMLDVLHLHREGFYFRHSLSKVFLDFLQKYLNSASAPKRDLQGGGEMGSMYVLS